MDLIEIDIQEFVTIDRYSLLEHCNEKQRIIIDSHRAWTDGDGSDG